MARKIVVECNYLEVPDRWGICSGSFLRFTGDYLPSYFVAEPSSCLSNGKETRGHGVLLSTYNSHPFL